MATDVQQVIHAIEELGKAEQHQVLIQLLKRSVKEPYSRPGDDELCRFADEIFLELDRDEDLG
ncbi:MAG: hypothetical protein H6Q48_214 [Deltaproteobacteria bacterium]|nr:hypothetical protein [Deltaproteobacteria bacterium]